MLWFHRLQQRLSLTRNEAVTLIVLSTLFAAGLVARHIQQQSNPVAPDAYVESDSLFFARSAAPSERPSPDTTDATDTTPQDDGPVDLNRASSADLQRLPRVGPATAERIIEFRESYGPFRHVDDLIQVRGIGPKTLEQIKPLATVEAEGLE